MEWLIEFHETRNGKRPAEEFINSLSIKDQRKIARSLKYLKEFGIHLREPHTKHLQDGIFELRTSLLATIARTLYFHVQGNKFILTNGFIKRLEKHQGRRLKRLCVIAMNTMTFWKKGELTRDQKAKKL
jgi:phage-related protein